MFKIGFKDEYRVLHINNELGKYSVGGAGTYMNEMYKYRTHDTGFIYMNIESNQNRDFSVDKFCGNKDILVMNKDESWKLANIKCDIMVLQFYEFDYCLTPEILYNKKLVYVVHSVPTPEPIPRYDPFGGNKKVHEKFEKACTLANIIVCVSEAEKRKLVDIYPHMESKIRVIYNGITFPNEKRTNENYKTSRRKFGFIGRTDYRKGLLECLKAFKNIDGELHLACAKNDPIYIRQMMEIIDACDMKERVIFHGWCIGKRKESFFEYIDALLIPSLYEPFGYVALEGMINGVPLISSNNGGLDEILEGYRYKYNPYEINALEETIKMFQEETDDEIEKQQNILQDNLSRFTAREMALNYNKLWREMQ